MATLTPEQATRSLQEAARKASRFNAAALRKIAALALVELEAEAPVLSGRFRDSYKVGTVRGGAKVLNTAPYATDVHDGETVARIPEVLKGLDGDWEDELNKTLTPILERG